MRKVKAVQLLSAKTTDSFILLKISISRRILKGFTLKQTHHNCKISLKLISKCLHSKKLTLGIQLRKTNSTVQINQTIPSTNHSSTVPANTPTKNKRSNNFNSTRNIFPIFIPFLKTLLNNQSLYPSTVPIVPISPLRSRLSLDHPP